MLHNPDGPGFVTSDHRYRFTPMPAGANTPPGWNIERNTAWRPTGNATPRLWALYVQTFATFEELRNEYTTPESRMPWVVADMDEGILRTARNITTARTWAKSHLATTTLRLVSGRDATCREYQEPEGNSVFIMRADHAYQHGFDATQQPRYPYPDQPHTEVDRPETEARR
jgi:hypothetical protein